MKSIWALAIALTAALAQGDTIGVTGSGTFIYPNPVNWTVSISGSDGTDSVSASCWDTYPFDGCPLGSSAPDAGLGASIDGEYFRSGFYSIEFGALGNITGYNSSLQPVITQQISAYIEPTSVVCMGPALDQECEETFIVASSPEPTTWMLLASGLLALALRIRKRIAR